MLLANPKKCSEYYVYSNKNYNEYYFVFSCSKSRRKVKEPFLQVSAQEREKRSCILELILRTICDGLRQRKIHGYHASQKKRKILN
jgi:hypothetical protein